MGLLEEALRQTFANRVAIPPGTEGMADRAIRQAGAIRRRRMAMASVAAVVTLVLVGVGVLSIRGTLRQQFGSELAEPQAVGVAPPAPVNPLVGVKLPVDVLNGDRIQVADGRVVSLAGLGTVNTALRVEPGWLVQTTEKVPERSAVWLVDEKGYASQVAAGNSTMVSPGTSTRPSPQVAWVDSGRLSVSNFVGDGLTGTTSTPGMEKMVPVRAVGAGVLLSGDGTWDMWFPDRGAYRATPTDAESMESVLGVTVDSGQLLALYANQPTCLTEVEPVAFVASRSVCGLRLRAADKIYSSPDGRWCLVITPTEVDVYDLATFWVKAVPAFSLYGEAATNGTWLDDSTFAVLSGETVIQASIRDRSVLASVAVPPSGAAGAREIIVDVR